MTARKRGAAQLPLRFPRQGPERRPLIESGPYSAAVSGLNRWRGWPDGRFVITGEAAAGKTRLLTHWAAEVGAALTTGEELAGADIEAVAHLTVSALAVDDADRAGDGLALLAAINLCGRRQAPILLSGAGDPSGWYETPPDLRSRLQSMSVVPIDGPDAEALGQRLREECLRRHLPVPEESVIYLSHKMPPIWSAVSRLADQIEITPERAYTLRSAKAALQAFDGVR